MIGNGRSKGIAPRAVAAIFAALSERQGWTVEVSVLEIYNERVRDLLASAGPVTHVEIHELRTGEQEVASFRCPGATVRMASDPKMALAALQEGMRRRETAKTDMNHSSSRSHLIYTISITQTSHDAGATLRSRLHLVDLAGSERLKRSMSEWRTPSSWRLGGASSLMPARSPRDQRREACEINKSLSQLALVIQRLTTAGAPQYIPYRDSALTRLLAESFGGSSKTCLIIAASPALEDREETKCSLEFGKRAKLVKNTPKINIEVQAEPSLMGSMVLKALVTKEMSELQEEQRSLEERLANAESRLSSAAADAAQQQEEWKAEKVSLLAEAQQADAEQLRLKDALDEVQRRLAESQDATDDARKAHAEIQAEFATLRTDTQSSSENKALLENLLADVKKTSEVKMARLESEKILLSKQAQDADAERLRLKDLLDVTQLRLTESQDATAEARKAQSDLEAEVAGLRSTLETSTDSASLLENLFASAQETSGQKVASLQSDKLAMSRRAEEADADRLRLQHMLDVTQCRLAESQGAAVEAKEVQTRLEAEVAGLRSNLCQSQNVAAEAREAHLQLEGSVDFLRSHMRESQAAAAQANETRAQLEAEVAMLRADVHVYKDSTAQLQVARDDLQRMLAEQSSRASADESSLLKRAHLERETRIQLEDALNILTMKLDESQAATAEARKERMELEAEVARSRENSAKFEGMHSELQLKVTNLENERVEARKLAQARNELQLKVAHLESEKIQLFKLTQEDAAEHARAERDMMHKMESATAHLQQRCEEEVAESTRLRGAQDQLLRKLANKVQQVTKLESEKAEIRRKLDETSSRRGVKPSHPSDFVSSRQDEVAQSNGQQLHWKEAASESWQVMTERFKLCAQRGGPHPGSPHR
eukprot:gnl/TRDRNA2_/TRDRNA2_135566_c1_seq1.p1 gnl/TRDRNA2_/TRDRNA2_135566_c1~~gnl/TRDRNA2_/TRDRNA2_135566_c1_seq1.p1  ORF type:complete len:1020 (-),score=248.16 gnl/TRDRNA2_/TRDRNA2_135566_c1_seq1:122-2791(-)